MPVGGSQSGGEATGGVAGGLGGSDLGGGGTDTQTGGTGSGGLDAGSGGVDAGSGGSDSDGGQASGGTETGGQGNCDPDTVQLGYTCESGWSATMSPYILNNNWWGTEGAVGQQCIWGTCQDGDTIGWVTNWDWSGGSNAVLTYVSVVFGWQWGFPVAGTGLPIQLSSGAAVNCGWDFTLAQATGSYNVAYDLWLHDTATPPSDGGQTDEIMIWLNSQGGGAVPAGSMSASGISIGGGAWNLWVGNVGWPVFSYLRSDNVTSATLDMMEFLNDLVDRGLVSNTKYLSGVQAGIEVRPGTTSGTLTTHSFYCRIQ